ncbi:MAG TPA: tyrosine-type recombinase/integrase [Nitrososphaeraceae archaeon]|nr:tyrosine-type recombinase/integrase [Nitrososphaeraceae archaeon]
MTTTTTNNRRIRSPSLAKYVKNVQQPNGRTAEQYEYRLCKFEKYLVTVSEEGQQQQQQNQGLTVLDDIIDKLKSGNNNKINSYDLLSDFVAYLREVEGVENPNTIRYFVTAARNFLEYNDVEISPRKFKLKVRMPKAVIRHKEAISKEEIREILLKCSNIKLKTYLMLLASTGMRATEALALRHKDFDFDDENNNRNNNPQAFVRIRGEFTKTRTDRYVFLTREMVEQCKAWTDFKYRRRRITKVVNTASSNDNTCGKAISQWVEPKPSHDDLFFAMPRNRKRRSSLRGLYVHMGEEFAKTLDRIGFGNREDGNESRREITFHSFRRFVKTTISDLGYQDFSEWFIGHAGSTYWRKKDSEKAELFRKIEPYLTFLDITGLESKGADMETKTEHVMAENLSLKQQVDELYRVLYAQGIIKKEA